jgi:hypothetical protein
VTTQPYGLSAGGFLKKPLLEILSEMQSDAMNGINGAAGLGSSIDLTPQESVGQILGVAAERIAEGWDLLQAIHDSFSANASGQQLVEVCALTGTTPPGPTKSRVLGLCAGTPATVLGVGQIASTKTAKARFASVASATMVGAVAWVTGTLYATGDFTTANGKLFRCVAGGTSGGTTPSGSTALGATTSDATLNWLCVGTGTGYVITEFDAQETGPIIANAGTLTNVETPLAGWETVYNVTDAYVLGAGSFSDAQLRALREEELNSGGLAAQPAIVRYLLDTVPNILGVSVYTNDLDTTDAFGLPPHSIQCVVTGGADADVAQRIFETVAGEIATYSGAGNYQTVVDGQGGAHRIYFDRPTKTAIYLIAAVTYDPATFPVRADSSLDTDGIVNALVAYGLAAYQPSVDVRAAPLQAQVMLDMGLVPPGPRVGVIDVTALYIGTAPGPGSSTPIHIDRTHIGDLQSTKITITLTPGSVSVP